MSQGPFFIPQGAPPGTPLLTEEERAPEAVHYFRIYLIFTLVSEFSGFGLGLWLLIKSQVSPGVSAIPSMEDVVFGLFLTIPSFVLMVPHAIALFAGRAKWVYTLGTVLIGLSMLWNPCCLIVTVPLLIVWLKPETKRWYGIT